jgi:NAD(P)-dependent dehydrogenase (short-subunit alcohol dehydrogenase family)
MQDSVLITGASTGLGRESALYLAERGFRVYATMRDFDRRDSLEEDAGKRNVQLRILRLDVTDRGSIDQALETVLKESGGVYGLINNAAVGLRGYLEDLTDAEIRQVFDANVLGTMALTRAVLPHMRRARRGRIVLISSVGGRIGSLSVSAYCASKFALEGFGESLSLEVAPLGVRVILIEPGIIKTERWSSNRSIAAGALDPKSPYYDWFRQAEREADKLVQSSTTRPADVAAAVHRALTVARPRLRYMVGWRARLIVALRRILPGELFERIYFGLVVRRVTHPDRRQVDERIGEATNG